MKKAIFLSLAILITLIVISSESPFPSARRTHTPIPAEAEAALERPSNISGIIKRGETLYDIFARNGLDMNELSAMVAASRGTFNLGRVVPGRSFVMELDADRRVRSLAYNMDGDHILKLTRGENGFKAEKEAIPYVTNLVHISGTVNDNLVSSMDDLVMALNLSDIFAWDIDFTTDLRKGDTFKVVVEEKRLGGEFVRYGNILSAEFVNDGKTHFAYRFVQDGRADYFDREGRSLRKAFLKAPLSFRRISSGFTQRRLHPILKTYRPHLGVDYAAPSGTPVSAIGDGTVLHAGHKGGFGNLVILRHPNGYTTYYGHLSSIAKGARRGARVEQGQVIGYVGSTGLATGPHLDYRVKRGGQFVNPLTLKLPPGEPVKGALLAEFKAFRDAMDARLASIEIPVAASGGKPGKQG